MKSRLPVFAAILTVLAPGAAVAVDLDIDQDPLYGDAAAEVVLVEFAHYLCSACAYAQEALLPLVETEFLDKGTVALVHKDLPFGRFAFEAAVAAGCAAEQGRFWEYHDALYADRKAFTSEDFLGYARELEMDEGNFATCLKRSRPAAQIQADQRVARLLGIRSTPSFLVTRREGKKGRVKVIEVVRGFVPFEVLAEKLHAALAAE